MFRVASSIVAKAGMTVPARRAFSGTVSALNTNKPVGVLGAGLMGMGIAQVLSQNANREVTLVDISEKSLDGAFKNIEKLLSRGVQKGKMTEDDMKATLGRITRSTKVADFAGCGVVIEAVTENPELKNKIFNDLCDITADDTILATNTSTISLTKIGGATPRQDKVVGMHFFNPVPVMPLVEIISGLGTSVETADAAFQLAKDMGKIPVKCGDSPGFVVNRILLPQMNEACKLLAEGLVEAKDIDLCMKLGANVPMGPLTLADFVGLDTALSCLQVLESELGPAYKPSPLLVKMVHAGWLGRKSGRGFFDYSK